MEIKNLNKKVAFHTLGCKLNFSETATIARKFADRGYEKVSFDSPAGVYVINTCSVTDVADKKCRNAIRKAIRLSPLAKIVVVGCYSQLNPNEISKIEGVDLILGTNEKFKIFKYLENLSKDKKPEISLCPVEQVTQFNESYSIDERTRSFLKVQDGCDYKCAYCTVSLARGQSRNMPIAGIVKQAVNIGKNGIHEVVLTGVNIGDFGKSTGENFQDLIKELDKVDEIDRFRISSIEPNLLSDEIIEFISASKRFVPHFHIPLQSGCNKILGLMKRRYNRELFEKRIKQIKSLNSLACIGVDVIVGFPGETEEDFDITYRFLKNMDISYLHVFVFSERKNTLAAQMDNKLPAHVKDARSKKLIELSGRKKLKFYQNNINTNSRVIFEPRKIKGKLIGFTDNYIEVENEYVEQWVNSIKKCKLIKMNENNKMNAEILD